jgi:Skp family chaperone for outer membrane proteins
MAAKLKVFCATNGLTRSLVAVSSKAKALEAWGTKQDLFKEGLASEVTDPAQMEAALAQPGRVVTQSALDAEGLQAALAAMPALKKRKAAKLDVKRGPSREALERVAKFEGKLADNDRREREALDDIARRRAALAEEETEVRGQAARRRRELDEKLAAARAAVAEQSR